MNRLYLFALLLFFLTFCMPFFGAGAGMDKNSLSPGMKIEKVGDLNIIVPEDSSLKRAGDTGVITIEDMGEYVARQMGDVKARLETLENEYQALLDEVKRLKEELAGLQNKGLVSSGSQNQ